MSNNFPEIVTVERMAEILGICKSSAYMLLKEGQVKHVKVGRKYIIPMNSVLEFMTPDCYNTNKIVGDSSSHERRN